MQDSPAYRLNHEEVVKAMEEGILFAECLAPLECLPGPSGAVETLRCEMQEEVDGKWKNTGKIVDLPAKAVLVAAGTHPNGVYEKEHPGSFLQDRWGEYYLGYRLDGSGESRRLVPLEKGEVGFFTSYFKDGRCITYFGDNHPHYAGNVVKAMASAKDGHGEIVRLFEEQIARLHAEEQPDRERDWVLFAERLDQQLQAEVVDAFRLTSNIVEVIVRAPMAARNFQPGQFYRMQNYEAFAERVAGFTLTMEGIALTGAWVDRERGLVSLIVLEMGGSSRLCALLEPGEKIVLMGPTGAPTEIPRARRFCWLGAAWATPFSFRSPRRCERTATRSSISPATNKRAIYSNARRSRRPATGSSGASTAGRRFSHTGRATTPSSATSSRRWPPTAPES
jgi:hypothetical protein